MPFNCDFPDCNNEGIFRLEYSYERDDFGNLIENGKPDYTGHRCEKHVSININHSSCGLPEKIFDETNGDLRSDLLVY